MTHRIAALALLSLSLNAAAPPQVAPFDDLINAMQEKWQLPGASLAVAYHGRLMLTRAYGQADSKTRNSVQPDSLFRIAGISKTLTAAAIQRLVEDGKLSLDATLRDLLQKTTDWGAYSTLGRIVEKASGQSYEAYVKSAVLTPLGITHMRLGHTTLAGRAPGEVRYYDYLGAPKFGPVFRKVPRPYAAESLEAMDAAAGWLASASDLLLLVTAFDGQRPSSLTQPLALAAHDWNTYGALNGVTAYVFREPAKGVDAVLLFNSRPHDSDAFEADLSAGVQRVVDANAQWPTHDLFVTGPELFARDVVNAAGRTGGGVAPGEILVMFPSNAGPSQIVEWPTATAGATRVFFDNVAAPVVYTVAGQISTIVPHEVANRASTELVIEYEGKRSPPVTLPVIVSAPALFTRDASGKGQAAMLNVTGCCNSPVNPAMRGAIAYLFATGEGLSLTPKDKKFTSEKASPVPVPVPPDVKVSVGGVPAEVLYAGDTGVLQVNIRVPENAPLGDAIPVVLTVGDTHSTSAVTMAVRAAALRILVADPDPETRTRLAEILQPAGYEVLTTPAGPVDLVITDIAQPEEMLRTLQTENPQLKIIAVSDETGPAIFRAADILGAQAFITKPLKEELILQRVHDILQQHYVAF